MLLLGAGNVDTALFIAPCGNLVPPPELTRDAPILDVRQPLPINQPPLLGNDTNGSAFDRVQCRLRKAFAGIGRPGRVGLLMATYH